MKTSKKWTIVLEGTVVVVLAVSLSVLAGCANPAAGSSSGSGTVTTADAVTATQTVMGAVNLILASQSSWQPASGSSSVSYTFPNYGLSISGTDTAGTDANSNAIQTIALSVTFSNFTDPATGYTVNGGATLDAVVEPSTQTVESGSITTGSQALTLTGGTVNTESWNITNFSSAAGAMPPQLTFTGNVTCNGVSFNAGSLSLGATADALYATMAVVDGVTALGGSNQWTSTATTSTTGTVSYDPGNGVSVSGTYTISGSNTIYTLTVSFSGYNDSANTGYTLTGGSLTVSLTEATGSTSPSALSMTGGPVTLSGGPVTTQTWNNVVFSMSTGVPGSGTISSNGTVFEANMI